MAGPSAEPNQTRPGAEESDEATHRGAPAACPEAVGPYLELRPLATAPGVRLFAAKEPSGRPVLLQVARCRAAESDEERRALGDYRRMVATATEQLAADPEVRLEAHGAGADPEGGPHLFWALPWADGAEAVGRLGQLTASRGAIAVATGLARRLEERQRRGRLDPLLSEDLVYLDPHGEARLAAFSIHLPLEGLDPEHPAPRLAPEEELRGEPRRSGDLWRLGRLLERLAAAAPGEPPELLALSERLQAPDPAARPELAEVLTTLESIAGRAVDLLEATSADMETVGVDAGPVDDGDAPIEGWPGLPAEAGAGQPTLTAEPTAIAESETPDETATRAEEPRAPAPRASSAPTVPPSGARRGGDIKDAATVRVILPPPEAAPPGPRQPPNISDGVTLLDAQNLGALPVLSTSRHMAETVVDEPFRGQPDLDLPEESTLADVPAPSREPAPADPGEFPTLDDGLSRRRPAEPTRRTVWDKAKREPSLRASPAQGGSPEESPTDAPGILGPRGTVVGVKIINDPTGLRGLPAHVGPAMLPPPALLGVPEGPAARPDAPPELAPPPPAPRWDQPPAQLPAPLQAPAPLHSPAPPQTPVASTSQSGTPPPGGPVFGRPTLPMPAPKRSRWLGLGLRALEFFMVGGLAALAATYFLPQLGRKGATPATTAPEEARERPTWHIHPAGEVVLDASPPDTLVVSEEDGRILGKTPLRFLLPAGGQIAVLLAAEGHEPQRLLLPERGRISSDLVKLESMEACEVEIAVPRAETLEAVGAQVTASRGRYTIPGAALLRSAHGYGAWLVRCPILGGAPQQALPERPPSSQVDLHVAGPVDTTLYLDGEEVGVVPFQETVASHFSELRVELPSGEAVTRWVPLFENTRLEMPRPRKRPEPDGAATEATKTKRRPRPPRP